MDEKHLKLAYGVARRYRIPGMSAEDNRQEAVCALLQLFKDFPGESDGWYNNKLLHHFRSLLNAAKADKAEVLTETQPDDAPGPPEWAISNEMLALLPSILTPQECRIVVMVYWENSSDAAIMEELGLKTRSLHTIRWRALKKIREAIVDKNS